MVACTETKAFAVEEQPKWTAGGDGFSGIVATAFVIVTITMRALIDISISDP